MAPLPTLLFCEQLFAQGMLAAERWPPAKPANADDIDAIIRQADQLARLDAPATAPTLDLDAARWSLSLLSWSVFLLVDRANASTSLPKELASTEPSGRLASHHWSVDLGLRYLSDVLARARNAASEDALVVELVNVCSRWPLASVGTDTPWNSTPGKVILDDPCLRRVLSDRVLARSDKNLAQTLGIQGYIGTVENSARKTSRD